MTSTVTRTTANDPLAPLHAAAGKVKNRLVKAGIDLDGVDVRGQFLRGAVLGSCDNGTRHLPAVDEVTWSVTEHGETTRYLVQTCSLCTAEVVDAALSGGTDDDVLVWAGTHSRA
ncbi:MAG: hypothetical protein L0I76_34990 [Pseudonocardia sp.]|nr:hypothetical protein [Pseudonocardia sp.]